MPRRAARPAPRRPRWQRRPDARPEEILEAALAVFGELGFARTRLEEVARRAGVSKGTLYLYFDSKDSLFRAMVQAKIDRTIAAAEELARTWEGSTEELLRHFIQRYWEAMNKTQHCQMARLVTSELNNFPELARFYYRSVILRVRQLIESILRRGAERGEFRTVDTVAAARALQSMCVHLAQMLAYFHQYDPAPTSPDEMLRGITDLYLHGVLARPVTAERSE